MNYQFPPELAEKVRRHMESGRFQSEEQLIGEAFKALDDREMQIEEIKRKIAAGVKQLDEGLGAPLDLEAFLERVNAKHRSTSNAV